MKEMQKMQQKQVELNLAAMKPIIKWDFNKVKKLKKGPHYNTANGEQDGFKANQVDREKKVLQVRYYYENDTPSNP